MEMLTDRKGNIHLFDENDKECLIHPEHIDEIFDFFKLIHPKHIDEVFDFLKKEKIKKSLIEGGYLGRGKYYLYYVDIVTEEVFNDMQNGKTFLEGAILSRAVPFTEESEKRWFGVFMHDLLRFIRKHDQEIRYTDTMLESMDETITHLYFVEQNVDFLESRVHDILSQYKEELEEDPFFFDYKDQTFLKQLDLLKEALKDRMTK